MSNWLHVFKGMYGALQVVKIECQAFSGAIGLSARAP